MAKIYLKGSEKTLIPNTGEAVFRRFNFGDDWTEIRLGFFASLVTSAGDDTNAADETLVVSGVSDLISFGIKDSSQTLPGQTGASFLGLLTTPASDSKIFASPPYKIAGASANGLKVSAYKDATLVSSAAGALSSIYANDASLGSGYCGFFGLKIVLNNRGLSTQSATMNVATDVALTDYSSNGLRDALNNGTYGVTGTVAWNDGAVAYDIPNCFWIRLPFFNNRIRLSAIRIARYAP